MCSFDEPHDASEALFRLSNVVLTLPHIERLTTGTFDRSFSRWRRRTAAAWTVARVLLHR